MSVGVGFLRSSSPMIFHETPFLFKMKDSSTIQICSNYSGLSVNQCGGQFNIYITATSAKPSHKSAILRRGIEATNVATSYVGESADCSSRRHVARSNLDDLS